MPSIVRDPDFPEKPFDEAGISIRHGDDDPTCQQTARYANPALAGTTREERGRDAPICLVSPACRRGSLEWEPSEVSAQEVDFARDVRPILEGRCYSCHGPKKQQSDFRLDDKARALRGGTEGVAIVPGHADKSPLIQRISPGADPEVAMPPKGERLTAEQVAATIAALDRQRGRVWPKDSGEKREHWASQVPSDPTDSARSP